MNNFADGVLAWVRGLAFIRKNRSLYLVAIIPFIISLILGGNFLWLVLLYYPDFIEQQVATFTAGFNPFWSNAIYYPALLITGILVAMGALYALYILHQIIAGPFYSVLAERTLRLQNPLLKGGGSLRDSLRMLKVGLVKTAFLVVIGLVLFVGSFIPGLVFFVPVATVLILGFDCMDYVLEARQFGFRERLRYLFKHKAQWAGVGAGLALTLLVPGLTLLVIPGAVVGCALIMKDTHESRTTTSQNRREL